MQSVPFFVKLGPHANSFSDPSVNFSLVANQTKEVTEASPLIKQWIMNGGLMVCGEDGEDALLVVPGRVKTTPEGAQVVEPQTQMGLGQAAPAPETTPATPEPPTVDIVNAKTGEVVKEGVPAGEPGLAELLDAEAPVKKSAKNK